MVKPVIQVNKLSKTYTIHRKQNGVWNSIKSLVNRQYEEKHAVKNISFKINEGELVGFIGPNGAGKTTTLKMLSGLLYPTSGSVRVLNQNPWEKTYDFLSKISLVMGQKNQLWWNLPSIESFNLLKEIYGISDKQYKQSLDFLVETLDFKDSLNIQVRQLSLGQRMKAELIASLLHRPKILFLDEPTIGLDVVMQQEIRNFISEYNREFNATVLLTSHYMDDVKELAKRVIIISKGSIIYDGSLSGLIKKYGTYKEIEIIFSKQHKLMDFSKFGEIEHISDTRLLIKVPHKNVPKVSAVLLEQLSVLDINIKEIKLEDIIRMIFAK